MPQTINERIPADAPMTETRSGSTLSHSRASHSPCVSASPRRWLLPLLAAALLLGGFGPPAASAQDAVDPEDPVPRPMREEESPILVEPQTPEATFDTIVLLVDLARPRLARRYLEQLMESDPDEEALLRIRAKHGPAMFLKLGNIEALKPLSTQLLERMNAAYGKWASDPERIDSLISELTGTPREREAAVFQLRSIGASVVPALLTRLSRAADRRERDQLFSAVTRIGSPAVAPLLAALGAPNDDLRSTAAQLLGFVGTPAVVEYLWYPAFSPDQPSHVQTAARNALVRILKSSDEAVERVTPYGVAAELQKIAARYYHNEHEWPLDDDGQVVLWSWRPVEETVAPQRVSPQAASLYMGTHFARQALAFAGENRDAQALYLGLALAWDAHRAGWDQPFPTGAGTAHDVALTAGGEVVTDVLAHALKSNNTASALGALRVLSQIDAGRQLSKDGRSPVVAALNYPDPRVQFAAATTILQWEPKTAFPGSDRVTDILRRAVAADTGRHAVVVDTNAEHGGRLAGLVSELGYEPELATTGQAGFKLAAERGDVHLIVLQVNVARWPLSQTIANLRADARTAYIPVVIYGEESHRHRVGDVMRRHPMVYFAVESQTADDLDYQLRQAMKGLQAPALSAEERARQRAAGVYWLARIADSRRADVFNLAKTEDALMHALNDPELANNALFALSALPTGGVQLRFYEVVTGDQFDRAFRHDAALQLAYHIQRHGVLLDAAQLAELRSVWQSAGGSELATALAAVIGSLKPDAKLVGERLQNHRPPTSPVAP